MCCTFMLLIIMHASFNFTSPSQHFLYTPPLHFSFLSLVLESDIETLTAMLLASHNQRIPLLVLSCLFQTDDQQTSLPSLDVADKLKLIDISNPWQVRPEAITCIC